MPDEPDLDSYFAARSADPVAEHLSPQMVRSMGNRRRAGRYARNVLGLVGVFALGGFTVSTVLLHQPTPLPAGPASSAATSSAAPSLTTSPSVSTTPAQSTPPAASSQASRATSSAPPPTATSGNTAGLRPVVKAGDTMTINGIGELTIGMPVSALVARGVVVPSQGCGDDPIPSLTAQGVFTFASVGSPQQTISYIELINTAHGTRSGISLGMTMGDVLATYGGAVAKSSVDVGTGQVKTVDTYVVLQNGNGLYFLSNAGTAKPADVITRIVLKVVDAAPIPDEFC